MINIKRNPHVLRLALVYLILIEIKGSSNDNCWMKRGSYMYSIPTKNGGVDYHTAINTCVERNSTIVSIHSQEENKFIDNLRDELVAVPVWIGMRRTGSRRNWEDGSMLDYIGPYEAVAYKNACIYLYKTWYEGNCDNTLYYICKKPNNVYEKGKKCDFQTSSSIETPVTESQSVSSLSSTEMPGTSLTTISLTSTNFTSELDLKTVLSSTDSNVYATLKPSESSTSQPEILVSSIITGDESKILNFDNTMTSIEEYHTIIPTVEYSHIIDASTVTDVTTVVGMATELTIMSSMMFGISYVETSSNEIYSQSETQQPVSNVPMPLTMSLNDITLLSDFHTIIDDKNQGKTDIHLFSSTMSSSTIQYTTSDTYNLVLQKMTTSIQYQSEPHYDKEAFGKVLEELRVKKRLKVVAKEAPGGETIGAVAIMILFVIFAGVVLLDLSTIQNHLKLFVRNVKGVCDKSDKDVHTQEADVRL